MIKNLNFLYLSVFVCVSFVISTTAHADTGATFDDAFSPHQGATELVVKAIGEAKKSIHVAAYSFTSRPIASALAAAHDRGVDVEVVLDKSDKSQQHGWIVQYLQDHKIPARLNYQYSIMHDKFMVIDENTLELGSFNYTRAAEDHNAENVLVIHDAGKIAKDYGKQWQKLWNEADETHPSIAPVSAGATDAPQRFDAEQAAQQHCPNDIVVWLNLKNGVYHLQGGQLYGNTKNGAYVCKAEADQAGDRETRNGQ